eukprot:gene856-4128_t
MAAIALNFIPFLLVCAVGLKIAASKQPKHVYSLCIDRLHLHYLKENSCYDQDTILGLEDTYTELGSLDAMPAVRKLLLSQGGIRFLYLFCSAILIIVMSRHLVRGTNTVVNTPICCPSRTETFSGRYFHNIGPPNQSGNCMFANTTNAISEDSMFGRMHTAGYNVGVFGKVTNDQQDALQQAINRKTMSYIDAPLDYNNYVGIPYLRLLENGTHYVEQLNKTTPIFGTLYQTTQIGNRTLRWLDSVLQEPNPFFLYVGPHAPHFPAMPAPWYEHLYDNATAPRTPNYNVTDDKKPQHIRQNPPLTSDVKCWNDQHFRDRWSSLKSVDEIVEVVVARLDAANQLNNTYIIFTSDHGKLRQKGQWRVPTSKQHPYETDIRVPFIVRGPGIPANSTFTEVMAYCSDSFAVPNDVDGRSAAQLLRGGVPSTPWRDNILIEYLSVGTYYNDHSTIWSPHGKQICNTSAPPRGPDPSTIGNCTEEEKIGTGNCYFIDSQHSNSWRMLRIMRSHQNWAYVEYELYDLDDDPYQMNNIYWEVDDETRADLHQQVSFAA